MVGYCSEIGHPSLPLLSLECLSVRCVHYQPKLTLFEIVDASPRGNGQSFWSARIPGHCLFPFSGEAHVLSSVTECRLALWGNCTS